jgi:hypothetical protein
MSTMSVVYRVFRIPVRATKKEVRSRIRKIKDRAPKERILFQWSEQSKAFLPDTRLPLTCEPFAFGGQVFAEIYIDGKSYTGESTCSLSDVFDLQQGKDRALAHAVRKFFRVSEETL